MGVRTVLQTDKRVQAGKRRGLGPITFLGATAVALQELVRILHFFLPVLPDAVSVSSLPIRKSNETGTVLLQLPR